MEINILPFIMEAFSVNKDIRKHIDKLYEKNKLRFYMLAKQNEYYKQQFDIVSNKLNIIKRDLEKEHTKEINKLKDINKNLKIELKKEQKKNKELFALRELMFSLDEKIEKHEDLTNVNLNSFKCAIIGGHEKWQQKNERATS